MPPLTQYFDIEKPLWEYVSSLSKPSVHPQAGSTNTARQVLGLVQRYALEYLGIKAPTIHEAMMEIACGTHPNSEILPRACLNDIPSTASLVQELIFTPVPLNKDGSAAFADLGTGTGILALATAIAATRSGASNITGYCIDTIPDILPKAESILYSAGLKAEFIPMQADITSPECMASLPVDLIRSWTSETINTSVFSLNIRPDGATWAGEMNEPYPQVLDRLLKDVPNLHTNVVTGKSLLFPDAINRQYRPESSSQTMRLSTSYSHAAHGPLAKIGADFLRYEPIVYGCRWGALHQYDDRVAPRTQA